MSGGGARGLAAEVGRFVRANLSSSIASGLEWVLVTVLVHVLRIGYLEAAAAGALTGAVTDFSLKRHWAFSRAAKGSVHGEAFRYVLVSGASLVLNVAGSYLLVDGVGLPAVPGIIAASLVIGFAWNYPLHRYYVFRHVTHPEGVAPAPTEARP